MQKATAIKKFGSGNVNRMKLIVHLENCRWIT